MPFGRDMRHNELDVVHKSHIKHLVGFVEDSGFHIAKFQTSAIQEVEHPAGRADDQMVFISKIADLHIDVGAADAANGIEAEAFGKYPEFLVDLERQFARRGQDENLLVFFIRYFVDERDKKSGRLARSRVGEPHDIPIVQNMGDYFVLDRRRLLVAISFESPKNRRIDLEITKLVLRDKVLHFFSDNRGLIDES